MNDQHYSQVIESVSAAGSTPHGDSNGQRPPVQLDDHLVTARLVYGTIGRLATHAMRDVDNWLATKGVTEHYRSFMQSHANTLRDSAVAMAERLSVLDSASFEQLRTLGELMSMGEGPKSDKLVDVDYAMDQGRIDRLDVRDIQDAIDFGTDLKALVGFATLDEEVERPLTDALKQLLSMMEEGNASVPGMVVSALKTVFKGHPRGFSRYYTGADPWPRPSAMVQAEIDERMPDALDWLRYELKEALEDEATSTNTAKIGSDGGESEEAIAVAEPSSRQRHLPVQADAALQEKINADPAIDPEHLDTLDGLKLLLTSGAEKNRVFRGPLHPQSRLILDDLLTVAIREIEVEHATVVGIVNVMIVRMLDICAALDRQELRLLLHAS